MKNNLIIIIGIVLIMGVGGFFGGMKYQQGRRQYGFDFPRDGQMRSQGQGQRMMGKGTSGIQPLRGEIISKDESSVTIKLPDGGSKIVLISETTTVNQATKASFADLKEGDSVMIMGKTNDDGSVTAQQVQLNFDLLKRN